jgi:hypothetical protein
LFAARPDRYSRRQALRLGVGALGLTLPAMLRGEARAQATAQTPPRAKSVVILYLSGGPSQLDTWDMKPDAPREIRGSFSPIPTNVPGTHICEHFPRMAQLADRYTIVRSMTHDEGDHLRAGHYVMTGGRMNRPAVILTGMKRSDRPHCGSVVASRLAHTQAPPFVTVPEFVSPRGVPRPGQHGGFLGGGVDPYLIHSDPNLSEYHPGPIADAEAAVPGRLGLRRSLLEALDGGTSFPTPQEFESFRNRALSMMSSPQARDAFYLAGETQKTRDRYGRHTFGQSTLIARRLIEAGVRLVQVNFVRHDNQITGQGYDSHSVPPSPPHLPWCRDALFPPTDRAFAALVEDLEERGLLDETLVVLMGEFGRTPRFNKDAGRDHWPDCYSLVLAGGGVAPGGVYGASDNIAGAVTRDPVSPEDLIATVYRLLGIDHQDTMVDLGGRPHVLVDGKPVLGLLA